MILSITPSLYNAYYYYKNSEIDNEEEFLRTLRKEPTPPNETMQRGIDFENAVNSACITNKIDDDPCVNEIANKCKNGVWQVRLSGMITKNIEIHGIADVVTPTRIYDVKRVNQYSLGKYENSIQHLVYMFCSNIEDFEYLICDGSSVFTEYYGWGENAKDKLLTRCNELVDYLMSVPKFRTPFVENWRM